MKASSADGLLGCTSRLGPPTSVSLQYAAAVSEMDADWDIRSWFSDESDILTTELQLGPRSGPRDCGEIESRLKSLAIWSYYRSDTPHQPRRHKTRVCAFDYLRRASWSLLSAARTENLGVLSNTERKKCDQQRGIRLAAACRSTWALRPPLACSRHHQVGMGDSLC